MEILNNLTKTVSKSAKRVGRGIGSKKGGHTTGRGSKGDKIRGKTKITFDGTKIKKGWIKRLPFLRGKHRLLSKKDDTIFNLDNLEKLFKVGATVDNKSLKCVSAKILSGGTLTKALKFKGIKISAIAKEKILAAGGKID
jgi:large subunit ribosomal protein L15